MENEILNKKINSKVQDMVESMVEKGLKPEDIDKLGKLVDIQTDIANQEYWQGKEEDDSMRYSDGREDYGRRGVKGTGRGRYRDGSMYGRRGVPGTGRRYRGHDMLDEMHDHYGDYSDMKEEYNRGNYGAESDMHEHLEDMGECAVEFVETLMEQADTPEEKKMIKKYAKKIHEATEMM